MKYTILFLATILFTISLSSCQKGLYEKKLTKKIEGHWVYQKAKYQVNPFKGQDQLKQFTEEDIFFSKDGTVEIINKKDNTYLKGIYSLETSTYLNINNGTGSPVSTMYLVQMSLTDTTDNSLHQRLWSSLSLTKKKLRYNTQKNDSTFNFVMNRQKN